MTDTMDREIARGLAEHATGGVIDQAEVERGIVEALAAARREGIERAAEIAKPQDARPCDCRECDCGSTYDRERVCAWDEADDVYRRILALSDTPSGDGEPPIFARPEEEWHEDFGPVLWWKFPIEEAPWCGCGQGIDLDWPGYHTHWTPLPDPKRIQPCQPKGGDRHG